MSVLQEKYMEYLTESGVLPRLLEILEQLVQIEPPPADPLMHILHCLGCPLIPQSQMKVLERKVSRAHDELRYLRRVLIDLGRDDLLYDSDTDEEEYVGAIAPPESVNECNIVYQSIETGSTTPEYVFGNDDVAVQQIESESYIVEAANEETSPNVPDDEGHC